MLSAEQSAEQSAVVTSHFTSSHQHQHTSGQRHVGLRVLCSAKGHTASELLGHWRSWRGFLVSWSLGLLVSWCLVLLGSQLLGLPLLGSHAHPLLSFFFSHVISLAYLSERHTASELLGHWRSWDEFLVSWSLGLVGLRVLGLARPPARLVLRLARLVRLALRHLARRRFRLDHCHHVSAYGATSVVDGRHNVWTTHGPRAQRRWRACLQSAFAPDVPAASRPTVGVLEGFLFC